jgi:imidazolonepropionase-like amidohydrolase
MTALDDRSKFTALATPRYFYSGEIFEGEMPHWGDVFYSISNEQEARSEVRYIKANGADFVKIYPSLPWKLQGVVSDEAHKVGLPIVGHSLSLEETIRRVVWGSTSVEHSYVTRAHEDSLKMLAAAHVVANATLSVGGTDLMAASDPGWLSNWRVQEYVPAESRSAAAQRQPGAFPTGPGDQTREQLLVGAKGRLDGIHNAFNDGVTLTVGTDSLMTGVYFGLSTHWEIAQFVDAGLTPIEALRMATQGGADLVGASRDLGSLSPGKMADMVLLNNNPLENIRNTQDIALVIKGGRTYDPALLRPGIQSSHAF